MVPGLDGGWEGSLPRLDFLPSPFNPLLVSHDRSSDFGLNTSSDGVLCT